MRKEFYRQMGRVFLYSARFFLIMGIGIASFSNFFEDIGMYFYKKFKLN